MALQTRRAPFRGAQGFSTVVNVLDGSNFFSPPAFTSQWTPGATLIDNADIAAVGRNWSLLSVAMQGYLSWNPNQPTYGKLGKVIGAVDTSGELTPTQGGSGLPYVSPKLPLPTDATLTEVLWDPNRDPLPPHASAIQAGLSISAVISLPIPITIYPGLTVTVGLWLTEWLVGVPNAGALGSVGNIFVQNATYKVNMDDGS